VILWTPLVVALIGLVVYLVDLKDCRGPRGMRRVGVTWQVWSRTPPLPGAGSNPADSPRRKTASEEPVWRGHAAPSPER
jgi:hypothetical protein